VKDRRIGPLQLVETLGEWSSGSGPLYLQLAGAISFAIDVGDLRPGVRLPAERALANTLAVSRTTVVAAFDHLKQQGYLDSAPGSGTWIKNVRGFNPSGGVSTPVETVGRNPLYSRLGAQPDGVIDFTCAVVEATPLVTETLEEAGRSVSSSLQGSGYYPAGWPPLIEAVADWFERRGLPTRPEEILITGGGQEALMLVAAAYIQPGDPVVVESPTFPGALDAFRLLGASVRTVPVGREGTFAEDILEAIDARKPRLTYLIPTYHNPTGQVMGHFERRRLARELKDRATVIVEDEAMVELSHTGDPAPPPIAAYHDGGLVVGSASKPFWGGLRVGWIRGRTDLIRRLRHFKTVFDMASPTPTQAAATLLFQRADEILAERRKWVVERREAMITALADHLPGWTWDEVGGGITLWVEMPEGSATEFAQVALRHGVALVPGPFFDPQSLHDDRFRLPYVLSPTAITEGVARMAEAWDRYRGATDVSSRPA